MAEQKVRIGILGCGLISDTHVEGILAALPNAEISVCDPLPGKAEMLRKKYNLHRSCLSLDELLDTEKPFSVHICTPPQYHLPHTIACLKAGCHVLVEKPFSLDVRDIDQAFEVARQCARTLCVDHSILYQPCVSQAFRAVESWTGSAVIHITSFFGIDVSAMNLSALPADHWKRTLPGGTAVDTIIHPITLAVQLMGPPSDVRVSYAGSAWQPDELLVTWKGKNGMASIMASTRGQPFRKMTEITTNKGTIVVDHSTEVCIPLDMGVGPHGIRKIQRNMKYGKGLITGTIKSAWKIARKKLKENPGARFLIAAYYKHLLDGGPIPVSQDNVLHSTIVLSKISEELTRGAEKPARVQNAPAQEKEAPIPSAGARKVLVTGASGLLGRELCGCLAKTDRHIIAQVRRSKNADLLYGPNIQKIYIDLGSNDVDYDGLLEGVEEVIHNAHSAGAVTWQQYRSVNVDAAVALYQAAKRRGCKKYVYLSSVAVYGVHKKRKMIVDEDTPTTLGHSPYDFYVKSKTVAERELIRLAREGGPELLILRPGILFAGDGRRLLRMSIPVRDGRLAILFGKGNNHLPYTRVEAVAQTICRALDLVPFPVGVYQLCGNSEESSREFVGNGAKQLGINCRFISLPVWPFRLVALTMEGIHFVFRRKKPPKLTRYLLDLATRDYTYDCSKAGRDLGWDERQAARVESSESYPS